MFTIRWIRRAAIVSAVVCASVSAGMSGVALADSSAANAQDDAHVLVQLGAGLDFVEP